MVLIRLAAAKFRKPRFQHGIADEHPVVEPWTVDQVEVGGGQVVVRGWSLPPSGGPTAESTTTTEPREFRINGRRCDEIRYPMPRPDVGAFFWQRRNADLSGFECRAFGDDVPYPHGVLEIERVRPGALPIERGRDCWLVPDPALHVDLPEEGRRYRVIGNRDRDGFLTTGATDYHRLDRAIAAVSGRRLHEFRRVLDWGSGCGRVARHFPSQCSMAFTGCDIDHDNVNWCSAYLRGTFVRCALVPPLPFADGEFELVYGVSVFTHLREALQFKWLDELARVTSKSAFLLMTVHGRTALEFARLKPNVYARLRAKIDRAGLFVTSTNSQIDGYADHRGEYVNVFHSHEYIRRVWSRRFEVLAIIPGYIFTHDLVVLRTR